MGAGVPLFSSTAAAPAAVPLVIVLLYTSGVPPRMESAREFVASPPTSSQPLIWIGAVVPVTRSPAVASRVGTFGPWICRPERCVVIGVPDATLGVTTMVTFACDEGAAGRRMVAPVASAEIWVVKVSSQPPLNAPGSVIVMTSSVYDPPVTRMS